MSAPGDIVAVVGLVTDGEGRVLISLSRRDPVFPGGQVAEDETLTAAWREVLQEMGIRLQEQQSSEEHARPS